MHIHRKSLLYVLLLCAGAIHAQNYKKYLPEIHGTVRARYEYQTTEDNHRFQVRNARVDVSGKVIDMLGYRAEVDLCDQGKIKLVNAYVRLTPTKDWKITLGQMRAPFGIDAHRSPHKRLFANRSFVFKHLGNVRDVGLSVGYQLREGFPFSIDMGVFSGVGINKQTEWRKSKNLIVTGKLQLTPIENYNLTLSMMKTSPGSVNIFTYGAGTFYEWNKWHFEVEGIYKTYEDDAYDDVWGVNAMVYYDLYLKKEKAFIKKISFLGRYDWMTDFALGVPDEEGKLKTSDSEKSRVTGGLTFSLGLPFQADLRLNYEKYFYRENAIITPTEQDRIVAEVMVRF